MAARHLASAVVLGTVSRSQELLQRENETGANSRVRSRRSTVRSRVDSLNGDVRGRP